MTNPFRDTAVQAEQQTDDRQGRNKLWWETKPMTYADWGKDDRLPKTEADFQKIEQYVLRTGPFLKQWFATTTLNGQACIDIGSGSGIFSSMLARRGAQVSAVDLTEAAVGLTRQTARIFDVDVNLVRADVEHMPFLSDRFDFAFSWGVLHHTSDMARAVGEMSRILKPGGRGMIMVYHRNSVVYYLHGLFWLLARGKIWHGYNFERVQDFYTDGFYHRYMTRRELGDMLSINGLLVEQMLVTQYEKPIIPRVPGWLDTWLKARAGMCLVARFKKLDRGDPG